MFVPQDLKYVYFEYYLADVDSKWISSKHHPPKLTLLRQSQCWTMSSSCTKEHLLRW